MTKFDDLNDKCLLLVLDLLPPEELFKMQRVNRRLNRLAVEKMRTKIKAISIYQTSDDVLSKCTHLNAISQDQVLVVAPIWEKIPYPVRPSFRDFFLSLLPRFGGVKSINTFSSQVSEDSLFEVFRLCPELECLLLGQSLVTEVEWHRVLELNGHKIVHFAKISISPFIGFSEAWLLKMVAEKCANIKRVDWVMDKDLTEEFVTALKMLPKNCWVTLECSSNAEAVLNDVDKLNVNDLDMSLFGRRVDRLSSLKFIDLLNDDGPIRGVKFAGLKTFDLSGFINYHDGSVDCLIASRFPQLQEFRFDAAIGITEDGYEALFRRMKSVEKLDVVWNNYSLSYSVVPQLPGSAIHQLESLKVIVLNIDNSPSDWQPEDFLKQLEQYVDEIKTLKKLTVVMKYRGFEWEKTVQEEVERINVKQNRVEVELVGKKSSLNH